MASSSTIAASTSCIGSIQPVANWVDGDREISVFQEQDKLRYSITRGPDIEDSATETGDISLRLYDTEEYRSIALHFIKIFKCALLGKAPREHCFLPIFWSLHERPDLAKKWIIGLFARLKLTEGGGKEVVEAQWGVNEVGREDAPTAWLEARDQHTDAFLIGAPAYRDKWLVYREHFEEVVILGPDDRIQSIVLRCVSALDRSIFLDEDTCAITLISAQKRGGIAGFLGLGHGSVAWEGMEAGRYFLKWADITTEYPGKQRGEEGARIRLVDREMPSRNWLVGPTCARSKELTNRMVEYLSRDVVVRDDANWSTALRFGFLAPLFNLFKSAYEIERERRSLASVENCLSFAVSALQRAKIFLPDPGRAVAEIEPNAYVMRLKNDYSAESSMHEMPVRKDRLPTKDLHGQIIFEPKNREWNDGIEDVIGAHFIADIEDILNSVPLASSSTQDSEK